MIAAQLKAIREAFEAIERAVREVEREEMQTTESIRERYERGEGRLAVEEVQNYENASLHSIPPEADVIPGEVTLALLESK